jgi:hypothetical protein
MPEGQFDFLGYTFGRMYSPKTGKAYLGYRPSKRSVKRMVEKIHAMTGRSILWQETTELLLRNQHHHHEPPQRARHHEVEQCLRERARKAVSASCERGTDSPPPFDAARSIHEAAVIYPS